MTATEQGAIRARLSDLTTRLEELLTKQEIHECISRYSRAQDRYDEALMRSTFHPDAVIERERDWSVDEWSSMSMARDRSRSRMHHIGDVLIEIHGDWAKAETYWVAYQVWTESDQQWVRVRGARYIDRFEPHDGKWKVRYRAVVDDWSYNLQVGEPIGGERSHFVGQPSPADPIYQLLQ